MARQPVRSAQLDEEPGDHSAQCKHAHYGGGELDPEARRSGLAGLAIHPFIPSPVASRIDTMVMPQGSLESCILVALAGVFHDKIGTREQMTGSCKLGKHHF